MRACQVVRKKVEFWGNIHIYVCVCVCGLRRIVWIKSSFLLLLFRAILGPYAYVYMMCVVYRCVCVCVRARFNLICYLFSSFVIVAA